MVKVDAANDLALLKAEGRFAALPVVASRGMRLGSTVATVGFPNVALQGFAPKVLAHGQGAREIAALSGVQDDARHFQISVVLADGHHAGSTGYQPVPSGNLPDGTAMNVEKQNVFATAAILSISFGRLPNETGESPVPPIAGERQLRGEEQFPAQLPGIGAGGFGQTHRREHEGAEV